MMYIKLNEFIVPKKRDIQQTIDLSNLSDSEVDELLNQAIEKINENG